MRICEMDRCQCCIVCLATQWLESWDNKREEQSDIPAVLAFPHQLLHHWLPMVDSGLCESSKSNSGRGVLVPLWSIDIALVLLRPSFDLQIYRAPQARHRKRHPSSTEYGS